MFDFLKTKRRRDQDRACQAYKHALDFCLATELLEPLCSIPDDDKGQLAYNLFLYGAMDAACQAAQVRDELFCALVEQFFVSRGYTPQYSHILTGLSQDQAASNAAFLAIIEGGRVFQDWIGGNAMAPASVLLKIENYIEDPSFPGSPGHLAVALMDRQDHAA